MRIVPAVEISSVDGDKQDLHVLGYLVDHNDAPLGDRLHAWRDDREHRAAAMADALRELGYQLDESELSRRRDEGKPIGRPHLADAVVRHPGNEQRLRSEGLDERSAFLEAYLIDGRPAFRPRTKPTIAESIKTIHDAGGVAVWAHPFWDIDASPEVLEAIDRFRASGLDGVECFYPTHSREQTLLVADRCAELDCSPPAPRISMAPNIACSRAFARSPPTAANRSSAPWAADADPASSSPRPSRRPARPRPSRRQARRRRTGAAHPGPVTHAPAAARPVAGLVP